MQQKSIYNETYKPLFINEMNDDEIKEFSKTLSQKLRHVKLALSKANLENKNSDRSPKKQYNKSKKKKLKPIKRRKSIIADYIAFKKKDMTPNEIFETCKQELNQQIIDLKKPFQMLVKKTKIAPINSNLLRMSTAENIKPIMKLEDSELHNNNAV